MMLARALLVHANGTEWVLDSAVDVAHPFSAYRRILRLFADVPSRTAPFSIHNMLAARGAAPGVWFAPTEVALMLRDTVHAHFHSSPAESPMRVYVARDGELNTRALNQLATGR